MAIRCDSAIWRLQVVSGDDNLLWFNSALEMVITFSKIEVVVSVACGPTEPSQIGRAAFGTICKSPSLKKCMTAVTCLHSCTLGQSG